MAQQRGSGALRSPFPLSRVSLDVAILPGRAGTILAMSETIPGPPLEGTILETLGIRAVTTEADLVVLEMDVNHTVHQPMGLLHGGASAVIAESAASIGAFLNCDPATQYAVGIELNISHLRAKKDGTLTATATPVRRGRTLQVWAIELIGEDQQAVATARCTLAVRTWDG